MKSYRLRLPSLSALSAFESAARNLNFSRAAAELRTSQPAVSRHISAIEAALGVRLFERSGNRVALSRDGDRLYRAVVSGFETIAGAIDEIRSDPQRRTLSIVCTYEEAHLWLMPRYEGLQAALGEDADIRLMSAEYEQHQLMIDEGADLCLTFVWPLPEGMEGVRLFPEAVVPVCAPKLAVEPFARGDSEALLDLPLLHLSKRNFGWLGWEAWFNAQGVAFEPRAPQRRFSNYVYLLEAAMEGQGVALGWSQFADRALRQGALVEGGWRPVTTGGGFHAITGPGGEGRQIVGEAIRYLSESVEFSGERPAEAE